MELKKFIPMPGEFLRYIKDLRYYLLAVIAIYVLFVGLGYLVTMSTPGFSDQVISGYEQKVEPAKNMGPLDMAWFIFTTNTYSSALSMLLGVLLGVAPVFFMMANGMVVGVVVGMVVAKAGFLPGILTVLILMLPHGVLELPLTFISSAIGLKFGYEALMALLRKKQTLFVELKRGLLVFVFYVVPLLIVAALIESFVTGAIASFISSGL